MGALYDEFVITGYETKDGKTFALAKMVDGELQIRFAMPTMPNGHESQLPDVGKTVKLYKNLKAKA